MCLQLHFSDWKQFGMSIMNDANALSNVGSMKCSSFALFLLMWLMVVITGVMGGALKLEQVSINISNIILRMEFSLFNLPSHHQSLGLGFLICESCHQVSELNVLASFLALVAGFFFMMNSPYGYHNSPCKGGCGAASGKNKLLKSATAKRHILPLFFLLCLMTSSHVGATTTSSNDNPEVSY